MYFTRHIWDFIQKIYFRRKKKKNFIEIINKYPSTYIPSILHNRYNKYLIKKLIKKLIKYMKNLQYNYFIIFFKKKYINKDNYKLIYIYEYILLYIQIFNYLKYKFYYKYTNDNIKLYLHIGRWYLTKYIPHIPLTLSVLTETIKYGLKKKKKKKNKWVNEENFY